MKVTRPGQGVFNEFIASLGDKQEVGFYTDGCIPSASCMEAVVQDTNVRL